jgi:hypothetical protein
MRVLEDENGVRYAKQFTPEELEQWLKDHPGHKLVR